MNRLGLIWMALILTMGVTWGLREYGHVQYQQYLEQQADDALNAMHREEVRKRCEAREAREA